LIQSIGSPRDGGNPPENPGDSSIG